MHENINNTNFQVTRQKKLEYLRKYYKKKIKLFLNKKETINHKKEKIKLKYIKNNGEIVELKKILLKEESIICTEQI